jgi:hypothetical protein
MKSFLSFISESKNTHLEHLEDAIFLSGVKGIDMAVSVIQDVTKTLAGGGKGAAFVSVKWDGAPAVICGQDPQTKQFFVATKSLFNKTPKVNYSHSDIDTNHGGSGVAAKLHAAFDALKDAGISGILQGDLMFTPGDIKTQTIDGETLYTFQPNTIMYAVPTKSDLGKRIAKSQIGIVFHTQYKGSDLKSLSASFNPNVSALKNNTKAWIEDASFSDATGVATLTTAESKQLEKLLADIQAFKADKTVTDALKHLQTDSSMKETLTRYFNSSIRTGVDKGSVPGLIQFAAAQPKPDQALIQRMRNYSSGLKKAFDLHKRIAFAKNIIVGKMNQVKTIGAFYPTDSGFRVANPEGFVAVAAKGVYKLVDRLEFSRQNFTAIKNWA